MTANRVVPLPAPPPARASAPAVVPAASTADGWRVVAALGGLMAVLGWTDVLLGLLPPRPGNTDWEFGAVSTALDAMPLGTLGVGLLAAALTARGGRRGLLGLAVAGWVVALGLVAAVGLYALAAPVVWRAAPPPLHGQVALAMTKTAVLAAGYLAFHLWLGVHCRRAARRPERR